VFAGKRQKKIRAGAVGSAPSAASGDFDVHPVLLSFSEPAVEKAFLEHYARANLRYWRLCHGIAAFFFSAYAIVHAVTIPGPAESFYIIGFGAIVPMFIVGYLFTYTRWVRARWQALSLIYVLATGAGALLMAASAGSGYSFFTLTGFLFCYMFAYAVIRLRFITASFAGAVLTLVFLARASMLLGAEPAAFWLGILYVLGFNALGMITAYGAEFRARRDYHSRAMLEREERRVKEINESLESRVRTRTHDLQEKNQALQEQIRRAKQLESERDDFESQLRQAQKMETIGRFAGGIAHDFNNLITIINSYAGFAMNDLREGDPRRVDLQQVVEAGNRAADLTRQLLAVSRKQVLQPKLLDLNTVIDALDKMLPRLIGEDIELSTVLAADLGIVSADPGQCEQVLMNLAVNSRDAMPRGGRLTIATANVDLHEAAVSSHPEPISGSFVMLSVTDTGKGMTDEVREQAFEPFFTTKGVGQGTGLGLSTVYGIVAQSAGHIDLESEPDKGTSFKIYLPRVLGAELLSDLAASQDSTSTGGDETILAVEDEGSLRGLMVRVLEDRGYTVLPVSRGDEALTLLSNSGPVDLLLTDVVLSGDLQGDELARRVLASQPDLPVLFVSGYTHNAIVHAGRLDDGVNFLQKPFTPDALAAKVREVLDQGRITA